jgi:hypothetical protein
MTEAKAEILLGLPVKLSAVKNILANALGLFNPTAY